MRLCRFNLKQRIVMVLCAWCAPGILLAIAFTSKVDAQLATVPDKTSTAADPSWQKSRQELQTRYGAELSSLADWCEQQKLTAQAERVRGWQVTRKPDRIYIFKLPDSLAGSVRGDSATDQSNNAEYVKRFSTLRQKQAERLFALAEKAHTAKQYTLSYDLVREACRENPDQAAAREILGYVRYQDRWVQADTARRLATGQVLTEKFGWLPADHVKRYDAGERYWRGKWIDTARDEAQHANIKTGWRISSEHYLVTTNHSLEQGAELARRLEKLHDVWSHVFVEYYTPRTVMENWFRRAKQTTDGDGKTGTASGVTKLPSTARRQYNVAYFRNREEYNQALRPAQAQIEMTLGIYFSQTRVAYFFADEKQSEGTLLHEAVHQLFQESRQTIKEVGKKNNFWIVEGVACYFESLVEHDEYYTLGSLDEGRAPAARERLLETQFYVPFGTLVTDGMLEFQRSANLPMLYSQIAGQTLFLMSGNEGQYRGALVEYLLAVYGGRADSITLARLTGQIYGDLDRQYQSFLRTP
ncbi:MAG: hypothetical protein SGJ20_07505 [Planctomycetota bacterium]|nr:hypothetical protein [Planctomycetota bacterium]